MRRRRRAALGALASALVLVAACSDGGGDASNDAASTSEQWSGKPLTTKAMAGDDAAEIDRAAEKVIADSGGQVPGIWVGVWRRDGGRHVAAYGEAATGGAAASAADHVRIGSITTTFTSTAVLQLAEEGKVALDGTLADTLPDLAEEHPEIADVTVDQLLRMRSGIPDYSRSADALPKHIADPTRVWTPDELIDLALAEKVQKPGTPGYSTTNYVILGQVLAKVTGKPPEEVMAGVTESAELSQTALPAPAVSALPAPGSHGYVNDAGSDQLGQFGIAIEPGTDTTAWSPSWTGTGGAISSTIEDLGTWASTGFGSSLLKESTVEGRMQFKALPMEHGYGQGLMDLQDGWIGHDGEILGWESVAAYDTDTGDVVVLAVNATGALPSAKPVVAAADPELADALFGPG